jgi:phosphoglycolate phosphatase-like HAD superfamily hydrolase
MKEIKQEL